jgi:hypothetical protein
MRMMMLKRRIIVMMIVKNSFFWISVLFKVFYFGVFLISLFGVLWFDGEGFHTKLIFFSSLALLFYPMSIEALRKTFPFKIFLSIMLFYGFLFSTQFEFSSFLLFLIVFLTVSNSYEIWCFRRHVDDLS